MAGGSGSWNIDITCGSSYIMNQSSNLMAGGSGSWNIDITCGSSYIMNQSFNPSFMLEWLAVLVPSGIKGKDRCNDSLN